ncbi:DUF3261 domain-containing protein [Marinobacterium lutimaris]|uniref:Outer-membrane lipoprotein LolB n=1 Tax=Marinobacterium lutimaris TaxID=568106 RepID=A0A1H5TCA2_9GAMM|nr:DUF3261 domain-containing protein [Marinobacterium lutimaris]SEF60394.1 Protein of unknown function [Marinobacterium lutimaris]
MIRVLLLSALVLLAGCGVKPTRPAVPDLLLLPMAAYDGPRQLLKQQVTLEKSGRQVSALSILRLDGEELQGTVLMASGQPVVDYRYSDEGSLSINWRAEVPLPVAEMVALMQFSLWPEAALQAYPQSASGWSVNSGPGYRQLLWYDRPVVSLEQSPAVTSIVQHEKGYSLQIKGIGQDGP